MYIYKVCTKFQSWLFKQDNFDIPGPQQRSWDFHKFRAGKIYRQIQRQLICLCHFYCCVQTVHRKLGKKLIRSNRSALEATTDCHRPLPDTHLTMLTIERQPKSDLPLKNSFFRLPPSTFVRGAIQPLWGYPESKTKTWQWFRHADAEKRSSSLKREIRLQAYKTSKLLLSWTHGLAKRETGGSKETSADVQRH